MSDGKFWAIADEFEERDSNWQAYVPKKNIKNLTKAILKANKGDVDETRADLTLFYFKQPRVAEKIYEEVIANYQARV